ncbi:uncharacterized protein EDB91DRAFT_1256204 [Suillus paluster]|uniref:uncharacterized protein n=1 Tax=Suillus paluster TaxID=48578 RepID=UPI001B85EC67|nr:uncharacterized protein EDB91DRAFT_1256204 [Suillus paluster]KAG1722140.1 hypothetical protein EDB91DRAFT_1256204 [Suillus paluster]
MSNAEGSALPINEQAEGSHNQLEEKLVALKSRCAPKERQMNYYVAQGRAIRCVVARFDSLEDLVAENDRRYDTEEDVETTINQDWLQVGYITFTHTMRWFHKKAMELEYEEYAQILKMVDFHNVNGCLGDDTSKLKALVSEWVNHEFKPNPLVDSDDKHSCGFINDACSRLLCPSELDWNNPAVKAGI